MLWLDKVSNSKMQLTNARLIILFSLQASGLKSSMKRILVHQKMYQSQINLYRFSQEWTVGSAKKHGMLLFAGGSH